MYDFKPKEYTSPLEKGDNPEADTLEELDEEGIKQFNDDRMLPMGCLMDNKINASSQEASYHMFSTYNDNK
jgi:hypothetical protein